MTIEQDNTPGSRRSGKSDVMERAIAALVRAGRRVTVLRPGGTTEILPLKRAGDRPTPDLDRR